MRSLHPFAFAPRRMRMRRSSAGSLALLCALTAVMLAGQQRAEAASASGAFEVRIGGRALSFTLPPSSAVTLKWSPSAASGGAWLTTGSTSNGLTAKLAPSTVAIGAPTADATRIVTVDPSKAFQTIDGFGGAMTDSSATVIARSPQRDAIGIVALQNEPEVCNDKYATMSQTPADQANLSVALRSALDAAGYGGVRILAGETNWTDGGGRPTTYPQQALRCSGGVAASPIDAVGYHAYAGHDKLAEVQEKFHADCAGKDIYFTEISGYGSQPNAAANLIWTMRHTLLGPVRHWARGSMYWNLALDEQYGPHVSGGCGECHGMITVKQDGSFTLNEEYYYWAQFSRFVDPGAVRIDSTDPSDGSIQTVAFKNPDGTIALVALNPATPAAATGGGLCWLFGC